MRRETQGSRWAAVDRGGRGARPEGEAGCTGRAPAGRGGSQSSPTASGWGSLSAARAGACKAAPQHQGHRPPPPDPKPPARAHPTPLTRDPGSECKCPHFRREGRAAAEPMGTAKGPTKAHLRQPEHAQDVTVTPKRRRGPASGAATKRSNPADGEEVQGFPVLDAGAKSKTLRKD